MSATESWYWPEGAGWTNLSLATPPDGQVVTLAQAKKQCRVDSADDDDLLLGLVAAATAHVDGPTGAGIPLLTQQWILSLDRWRYPSIVLPLAPVRSVDQIEYVPFGASSPQVLDPGQYSFNLLAKPVRIRPLANPSGIPVVWPIPSLMPGNIQVTFTCGFGDPSDVPPDIVQAILLLVSHWYEHRDAVVGVENRDSSTIMPLGVDAILDRYRAGRFA